MKKILITGANGYIGNCLFHFLKNKFSVIGVDKDTTFNDKIYKCNILNIKKFEKILLKEKPTLIVHLAAKSLVDEKIKKKEYIKANVKVTKSLLKSMKKYNITKLIFSSTAGVYKDSLKPVKENAKINPLSNYTKTKLICEKIIKKNKNLKFIILRFFNVCSALDKPRIGVLRNPITPLIPTVVYKALFNKKIYIYGNDYNTPDGTCVRDYIHIKDICSAIEKSINFINKKHKSEIFNIGNKEGISNKNVLDTVEKIIKKKIDLVYAKKRKGDIEKSICDSDKAKKKLDWIAKNSNIIKIIKDEIFWIKKIKKMGLKRRFKNYNISKKIH